MIKYTELKQHNRQNLIDILPLQKPFTILIEPSNYCNFKCVSCFQSLREDNYLASHRGMMDLELYKNIMKQLKNWEGDKIKVLKLSLYGEPLTNPEFCEMLRLAREYDISERIETTTNASLISKEIAECMVETGIDYIRVSIYGANQERYEKVTAVSTANIDAIKENLRYIQVLKEKHGVERPFVSAKMLNTFSDENEEFMSQFQNIADEVYIDMPHNWVSSDEKSFINSLYDDDKKDSLKTELNKNRSEQVACPMPFTTLAIRCNGDVSPCCVDWSGGTNLGNISEMSLKDIWNGDELYNFRKMQLEGRRAENESCKRCEMVCNSYYTRDNIDGFPVEKLR